MNKLLELINKSQIITIYKKVGSDIFSFLEGLNYIKFDSREYLNNIRSLKIESIMNNIDFPEFLIFDWSYVDYEHRRKFTKGLKKYDDIKKIIIIDYYVRGNSQQLTLSGNQINYMSDLIFVYKGDGEFQVYKNRHSDLMETIKLDV